MPSHAWLAVPSWLLILFPPLQQACPDFPFYTPLGMQLVNVVCMYQSYNMMRVCGKVSGVVINTHWPLFCMGLAGIMAIFTGLMWFAASSRWVQVWVWVWVRRKCRAASQEEISPHVCQPLAAATVLYHSMPARQVSCRGATG